MDSVNSGSHQSSSDGNDEPYDPRAAADSLFVHNPSLSSYNNIINSSSFTHPNSMITQHTQAQPPFLHPPPSSAAGAATHAAARNPRKRSRASRRAPTTVLTTDTSNFRAMVQEFTGIPSTPFGNNSNSSNMINPSFSARTLFRSTALGGSHPATLAHLRRPFPQRFQPTITSTNLVGNNDTNSSSDNVYQQLPISTQASDLYNVATNPFLSSLLQTATAKFIIPPSTDVREHDSNRVIGMDGFDHVFTSGQGGKFTSDDRTMNITSLPSLVSTDQAASLRNNGNKAGGNSAHADDDLLKPTKMAKYNGDSSNRFDGEKGLENASATRSEGMIESWICSTDYS